MENKQLLKDLIRNEQTDRAIEMVRDVKNECWVCEEGVLVVLSEEKSAQELVEAVLETFLSTRENRYQKHSSWVRCLSHFIETLWERRMDDWIKKFNEVSFKGAVELHDFEYSERLAAAFSEYAKFDDDPAEFALTPENFRWIEWKKYPYSKARVEAGRFESEKAFLRWMLNYLELELQTRIKNRQREFESLEKEIQKLRAALA